jgi:saccharopine dehydrogenase-like NADP-dependent oxidoreductase
MRARYIDVDDVGSVERALDGIAVVVVCVRQREPHLLHAAASRGIAYTSIAPPWMPWAQTEPLRALAERTGARIVLAAGIEPGIASVLARAAADRLGEVDAVETALLFGLGDAYGADSMAFVFEEMVQPYSIVEGGESRRTNAFERPKRISFPPPIGARRAYTMPFRDQLYYPTTLGAKTAIARIALDPPWLAPVLSRLLAVGLRRALRRGRARGAVHGLLEKLRGRYWRRDHYALVVEVTSGDRTIRSTVSGRRQAEATAAGALAVAEALWSREMDTPGVWLAEQVIDPKCFFARLAVNGIVPVIEDIRSTQNGPRRRRAARAPRSVHPTRSLRESGIFG